MPVLFGGGGGVRQPEVEVILVNRDERRGGDGDGADREERAMRADRLEEIREAGAVGAWEYDMDTMEERECDGDESGEVFRVMREDA